MFFHALTFSRSEEAVQTSSEAQELDVNMFSLLVYPLRSRGKDGHFADAQIVSG